MSNVELTDSKYTDILAARISACMSDLKRVEITTEDLKVKGMLHGYINYLRKYDNVFSVRQYLDIAMSFDDLSFLMDSLTRYEAKYK